MTLFPGRSIDCASRSCKARPCLISRMLYWVYSIQLTAFHERNKKKLEGFKTQADRQTENEKERKTDRQTQTQNPLIIDKKTYFTGLIDDRLMPAPHLLHHRAPWQACEQSPAVEADAPSAETPPADRGTSVQTQHETHTKQHMLNRLTSTRISQPIG